MPTNVIMPQLGESVVEGTVTKWLKQVGDRINEYDPILEINTDKVDTEIPSSASGVLLKILVPEGTTVNAGTVLGVIGEPGEAETPGDDSAEVEIHPVGEPFKQRPAAPKTVPHRPAAKPAPDDVDSPLAAPFRPSPPPEKAPAPKEVDSPLAAPFKPATPKRPAVKAPPRDLGFVSPVVAKLAQEQNVDLQEVTGTGNGGRITKKDVLDYLASGRAPHIIEQAAAPQVAEAAEETELPPWEKPGEGDLFRPTELQFADGAPDTGEAETSQPSRAVVESQRRSTPAPAAASASASGDSTLPVEGMRKLIAEHMVYSKTHSPHVGTLAEVDLTRVMRLRNKHKDAFAAQEGFALTLLPLAAAATVRALKEFPRMNSSVVGDSLIVRHQVNLGIAMDTEEGLLVPVLKAAEGMSVVGLAREIERLRRKIAEKKITADDLAGGSFTLTNPGREGNLFGFAIINQPQVGILRMGEIKKRPVVVEADGEDTIAIRTMMYLALSYDHRVIDGVLGNRFLYRAARILEEADFEL
jgi:pyruvate/2-oxoglutarate dehydrogenase complex dihydrolipoamide acyltransferase (E2) component